MEAGVKFALPGSLGLRLWILAALVLAPRLIFVGDAATRGTSTDCGRCAVACTGKVCDPADPVPCIGNVCDPERGLAVMGMP